MRGEDIEQSSRLAGLVKRYHTWPTIRQQNNAEHSWHVARIYRELFGVPPAHVADYIQYHDTGEIVPGDLPFGTKARDPELKRKIDDAERDALFAMGITPSEVTPEERQRVKLCDNLEMYEFGTEEFTRGNEFAVPIMYRTRDAIEKLCGDMPDRPFVLVAEHIKRITKWST